MNLQSLLIVHLFIANVSIHCSAIFSKEQICIYLQTCLEFDTFNSFKSFVRIRAFQLTLYLMGGGIECLPIAKVAPVHQVVTFLLISFDDNFYLYIYYKYLFLHRPKVDLKKFYRCSLEPGVIFKNKKLSKIFVSEATESCKVSKWGYCGVPSTTRPFPGGLHMYFIYLYVSPLISRK